MSEFEIGTKVRHVTGGPVMAVIGMESGRIVCEWRTNLGETKREDFLPEVLAEVPGSDERPVWSNPPNRR